MPFICRISNLPTMRPRRWGFSYLNRWGTWDSKECTQGAPASQRETWEPHSPSSGSNYSVFLVYALPETMQQSYIIFKWQIFLVLTLAEDCGKIYSKGNQRIWHLQCPVTWGRVQRTKNQPCTAIQVFSNYLFSKQLIRRMFLRAPLNFSSVHAIFTFPLSCFPSIFLPGMS